MMVLSRSIWTAVSLGLLVAPLGCRKSNGDKSQPAANQPAAEQPVAKQPPGTGEIKDSDGKVLPKDVNLDLGGGVTMELVLIPAGEFMMGSPRDEAGREDDEWLPHRVKISRPFHMGKYEVTRAQWKAVMGTNPSQFKGEADRPVESVSWDECQEFCVKLSAKCGRKVRLPTEAEWEYACRAGSKGKYCFGNSDAGLDAYAWYNGNSGRETHPVGRKKPNVWGLYDMHGNVFEWCQDWYQAAPTSHDELEPQPARDEQVDPTGPSGGYSRVERGGSWTYDPSFCRSAAHSLRAIGHPYRNPGLRVAAGTD